MKYKPNEKYSYSNGGFVFLGVIIEKLTNQLYRDFITNTVLKPAKMNDSGFFAFNDLPSNTAIGYHNDRKTTNIYSIPIRGGGDGGMYTTSHDLKNFWSNLFSLNIISKELLTKYLSTYHIFNDKRGYGCGIYKYLDNSMFYIVGGDAGVGFDSRFLPDTGLVINILSNVTDGEEVLRKIILNNLNIGS